MPKTAVLLINARSRSGEDALKRITAACKQYDIDLITTHRFKKGESLTDCVQVCLADKPQILIVAGGDGTVSGTIGKLAKADVIVGIVPLGTTNNVARSLNLPLDIEPAVKRIAHGSPQSIDLAQAGDHMFVNVLSIGVAARIADAVTDRSKKFLGRFAYAYYGVREVLINKPFKVTITDPQTNKQQTLRSRQIIVANGRFHAGTEIADDATLSDGRFIVFALGDKRLLDFLWRTARYFYGRRKRSRHIAEVITSEVTIRCNPDQPIECDGERLGNTPVTVTMLPKAVRVIC